STSASTHGTNPAAPCARASPRCDSSRWQWALTRPGNSTPRPRSRVAPGGRPASAAPPTQAMRPWSIATRPSRIGGPATVTTHAARSSSMPALLHAVRYNHNMPAYRRLLLVAAALLLAGPALAQDWKGMGRLEGRVLDADGKPLPDVSVKLNLPSRGGGTTVKTDKKGHWAIGGITSGAWQVDLEAPGFVIKKITINLPSESARLAPVEVKLDKAAPAGPPPEVREALEKGD